MNERIKELVRQADEYAEQTVHYYQGQFDGLTWEGKIKQTRDTKFAQLIVRECMNICAEREEDIMTRIKDSGKAATAYMCRVYIKDHFGVEE